MASSIVRLRGQDKRRFLEQHEDLHDAEIVSLSIANDRRSLSIGVNAPYSYDLKTNFSQETDTSLILSFNGLSNLKVTGELVEYSIYSFELSPPGVILLVTDQGAIEAGYEEFHLDVEFKSQQNPYG